MTLHELMIAIQDTPLAAAVRQSTWIFPTAETVHVLALALTVGSIAIVDLRLLGAAHRPHPVTELSSELLPWTWGGFLVAVGSGALLFTSAAADYASNPAFLLKLALLGAAGANMLVFHFITYRTVGAWDLGAAPPFAAKVAAVLSLTFWTAVVVCGRVIGFTLYPLG